MRFATLTTMLLAILLSSSGFAGELTATAEVKDGNTLISCISNNGGSIVKAYISIFGVNEDPSQGRKEMEVSVDNKATYLMPGVHRKIEGRCKLFMAKKEDVAEMPSAKGEKIARSTIQGEFSLDVN